MNLDLVGERDVVCTATTATKTSGTKYKAPIQGPLEMCCGVERPLDAARQM